MAKTTMSYNEQLRSLSLAGKTVIDFLFFGTRVGGIDGVPTVQGHYHVSGGGGEWLTKFKTSTLKVGETFVHDGQTWEVVRNNTKRGDGWTAGATGFIAVKVS